MIGDLPRSYLLLISSNIVPLLPRLSGVFPPNAPYTYQGKRYSSPTAGQAQRLKTFISADANEALYPLLASINCERMLYDDPILRLLFTPVNNHKLLILLLSLFGVPIKILV
jgi:hypothetical protein